MVDSPVDEIKNRLDIIDVIQGYIRLQKAGRNYKANCPFHSEKTPSFFVSPERQLWRCFGCGVGGSIFDFVMQIEGVEFGDALRILAKRACVELKKIDPKLKTAKTRLYEICELATRFFGKQLEASQAGDRATKYLKERGLKIKTLKDWRIGYAPEKWHSLSEFLQGRGYKEEEIVNAGLAISNRDNGKPAYDRFRNRIVFPIFDMTGLIIGFSGRIFGEGEPKYLNTPNTLLYDKSLSLYGLDKAKLEIRKKQLCVFVEGQMDVLVAHQAGWQNVVATSGTALTPQHLSIIKRYTDNLAMAFDMDMAGENATKRGVDMAIASGLSTKIIVMPEDKDPADFLSENPKGWSALVEKAQSVVEFYFTTALSRFDSQEIEGKKSIAKIVLPIIKKIPNRIEQAHWLNELAIQLKTDEKILTEELQKITLNQAYTESKDDHEDHICLEGGSKNLALAQYALGLLLTYPSQIESVVDQKSHIFIQPELKEIFKKIKKVDHLEFDLKKFQKSLPTHLVDQISNLLFVIETIEKKDFKEEEEVIFCFSKLNKDYLHEKLSQLNLAIKKAESKKDVTSLRDLTTKFHKLSQQLASV